MHLSRRLVSSAAAKANTANAAGDAKLKAPQTPELKPPCEPYVLSDRVKEKLMLGPEPAANWTPTTVKGATHTHHTHLAISASILSVALRLCASAFVQSLPIDSQADKVPHSSYCILQTCFAAQWRSVPVRA